MSAHRNLLVATRDDVLWVRINRPQSRNALSRETLGEIGSVFAAHVDAPVKAAVITGEGAEAFAAGGDLKELASVRAEAEVAAFFDQSSQALDQVRRFPLPIVAALNGTALGGGSELAVACDFRVAAPAATIGFIQARLDISAGFGGARDLIQLLGPSRAMAEALRARTLTARDALASGLVDEVTGDGETLEQGVLRFLQPMLRQKPQVIRAWKAFANAARAGATDSERRQLERQWFVRTWMHDDHWAAVDAITRKWQEKTG
jgi:enoyl-CoA hydratase/carnithine racemase